MSMIFIWILSYSIGLICLGLSLYTWRLKKSRADGLFAIFLGVFFLYTVISSLYILFPYHQEADSLFSLFSTVCVLGISVVLPVYTQSRSGQVWLKTVWFPAIFLSLAFIVVHMIFYLQADEVSLNLLLKILKVYISLIVTLSVLPFFLKRKKKTIPHKMYYLAGILSVVFSLVLIIPIILENWGIHLPFNIIIPYLAFYGMLNLRFIFSLLPQIMEKTLEKHILRKRRLEDFRITPREQEVYDLLAKGYTYKEIGRLLSITLPTVKTHIEHLYQKTETSSKVELINEIDG